MLAIARNIVILFSAGLILLLVGCGESNVGATQPLDSDNPESESFVMDESIGGEAGDNIDVYVDGTDIVETGEGYDPSLDVEEVVPIATPRPAPTPTPTPTAVPTATKVPVKAALMQSLPVDVSAVLSAGPIANSLRTFAGFGMPNPHDPNRRNPQWEFTVPLGTPALSPVSGTVFDVPTLWSDDYSVMIQGDEGGWIWEVEHVMNVEVSVGERVEAGQKIATASDFPERIDGKGFAIVELGLLEGGRVPTHHCPLLYIDQTVLLSITAGLDAIRQENLQRLDRQGLVSDPVNDPYGQACWTHDPILDYAYAE